jgi:hypothetical protein
MTRHLTEAEARYLATRDRILARRNPELLAREKAEFEAMSDEELRAVARLAPEPARGGGVLQPFAVDDLVICVEDPYHVRRVVNITWSETARSPYWQIETAWKVGDREHHQIVVAAELRRAGSDIKPPFAIGDIVEFEDLPAPILCGEERVVGIKLIDVAPLPYWQVETTWQAEHHRVANADELRHAAPNIKSDEANRSPSDNLWLKWEELDRLWGEAYERFEEAAVGAEKDRQEARVDEVGARIKEVEWQISNIVPTTVQDCLTQIRLLKANWHCVPGEREDLIVDNLLAGLEAMATAGG